MGFGALIHVHVDEIQPRGAPMAEESRFDMFNPKRLTEQRIVVEINPAHAEVVGGAPIGISLARFFG